MSKILVTGANGYIGSHVIHNALLHNLDVTAVDLSAFPDSNVKSIEMNLLKMSEYQNLYEQLGRPETIIHLAWQDGFNHKSDAHLINLPAHYLFIKNMIDSGCKSISIMGSMHEIGYYEGAIDEKTPCNPLSLYGIAKNALRQSVMTYCDGKDVSLKWLRAFYITGDDKRNKSIFSKILEMAHQGKTSFPFTDGKSKFDFLDIDELANQIVMATTQNKVSGIINVCSGKPVALKDKVEEFIRNNKLDIRPEYGAFPSRKYDSPAIWGNAELITKIMEEGI